MGECLHVWPTPRPYEDTDITGARGLTEAQRTSFLALGAVCQQPQLSELGHSSALALA